MKPVEFICLFTNDSNTKKMAENILNALRDDSVAEQSEFMS